MGKKKKKVKKNCCEKYKKKGKNRCKSCPGRLLAEIDFKAAQMTVGSCSTIS